MRHYIIIGNGVAAVGCIEGIRSVDKTSGITVISKENHPVYCRPLISYYLQGKASLDKMNYRPEDFYDKNGCEVLYGETASAIDTENQRVILKSGSSLPYTSVCVAAGSSPFLPPFEGLDTVKRRFSFMTLDDTTALDSAIAPTSRVLIIGGGLIGLKCAEGLCGRVKSITVCDLSDRVLCSILDADTAGTVQKKLEENGIDFLLSDSAVRFDGQTAHMKSGKTVDFDILVTAVGVKANTKLISDAHGQVGRGITVDARMKTDLPDVYAAGDCAEGFDISLGKSRVLAILPNAYMQGHAAGVNMAGGSESFDNAIPMNSIGFFGFHIMTAGSYVSKEDGGEIYESADGENVRKFFVKDGLLRGFMLIGDVRRGGIYTSLIRNKIPLDSVDFELLQKNATFLAFLSENRRKMFGGVV